jgi:very-short-patch-repair endonuclease
LEYNKTTHCPLKKPGVKILRFTNNEVFADLTKVIEEILKYVEVPEPPLGGRG